MRFCRLYNDKYCTAAAKRHQKMKQKTGEMEEQREEHGIKKTGGHAWPWMTPEVVFAWKTAFLLPLSLSLHSPVSFSPAVWRASDASLASSQEVKLNCRARLPNDERLWHPGMLWTWTKSSEREKMLAFQLNTFFLLHIFSLFLVSVFPASGRAILFFLFSFSLFFTSALATQPWSKSSSWETGGWMDGSSEEEEEDEEE